MNANLISSEAHALLAEIAAYEEPRLFLDESPTLASLAKEAQKEGGGKKIVERKIHSPVHKGHQSDRPIVANERRQAILSVIKDKGTVHIKDISTVVREISEKTIQRELSKLVQEGALTRSGDRRWTVYSLAS
jgi:predicted HTH transcriptional regulator